MKNVLNLRFTVLMILLSIISLNTATSQSTTSHYNEALGILHIDTRTLGEDPIQVGNLVRAEIEKLDKYELIDKYDIEDVITQNNFDYEECFGARCVRELGKLLDADKMVTGSAELIENKIIYTLKLHDVISGKMIRSETMEFLNIKHQVRVMTHVMVKELYDQPQDKAILDQLTIQDEFETSLNVPEQDVLALNGPRVGVSYLLGESGKVFGSPLNEGGYDAIPLFTTIGYQFEWKYLNTGNMQALVEFLPTLTGVDKGLFIPSLTILNGLRSNVTGLEIAIGPNFTYSKTAKGYYKDDTILDQEVWVSEYDAEYDPTDQSEVSRLDSRGNTRLKGGLLIGIGKTFRSGKLNIPLNIYIIPGRNNSHRVGFSAGFNIAR